MDWDKLMLAILAIFGCATLILMQVSDILSRLPEIIRACRSIRQELRCSTIRTSATPPAAGPDESSRRGFERQTVSARAPDSNGQNRSG